MENNPTMEHPGIPGWFVPALLGVSCSLCGAPMLSQGNPDLSKFPESTMDPVLYCSKHPGHWVYPSIKSGWTQVDADLPIWAPRDGRGERTLVYSGRRQPWHTDQQFEGVPNK